MNFIEIKKENKNILADFIPKIDSNFFRYFDKRNINCIENHILTIAIEFENEIIGYAHIDKDNDINWFGIFILNNFTNKGIGLKTSNYILNHNKIKFLEKISLSVDKDNISAIKLYEKLGFKLSQEKETYIFMERLNQIQPFL